MIFYDFEVFRYDWLVVLIDLNARKETVIINDPDKLKRFYEEHKGVIWAGYNSRNYDQYILKAILCGFDPKPVNDWIIAEDKPGYRYMRDSLRTADRSNMDRLKLECALGLCGEAGEVAEQVKKHFFHGHELDKRHMIEELGDVAWYLAVLCDAIGSDLDTVMEENLKKLEQRYPEGFDPYRSQHRNELGG